MRLVLLDKNFVKMKKILATKLIADFGLTIDQFYGTLVNIQKLMHDTFASKN